MSRSNPTTAANPAHRFFEWKAEKGELQYYDKEKKENIPVKLPFSFLILDEVSQVGGGIKVNGKYEGYWSNAVKNLNTQIITVKSKGGIVAQGLYAELKERKGLHYEKGLYIAFHGDNGDLVIGFLKFKGSSLGAWFEFTKAHRDLCKGAFTIKSRSEVIEGDKGDYYTPIFTHKLDISEESDQAAIDLDRQLQEYLTAYFAHKGVESDEPAQEAQFAAAVGSSTPTHTGGYQPSADEDDDIPF
jgi:hypothetical protein